MAPKGSRAKWHATQVWKETDCAAVRLNSCRTSANQTSSLTTSCGEKTQKLRARNEEKKAAGSDNSLSSLASLSDSLGDSDSGVQENAPTRSEVFPADGKQCTDQDSEPEEEEEAALMVGSQQGLLPTVEDDDNASTNSNLNTMSDIPSITAATVDGEEKEHETLYNSPTERRYSNVIRFLKPQLSCGHLVDSGTQTYFTGPVMATQVYHDETV
ncbi:unnamed protein product [Dibothriocephalus latus]|uniref:Uncharacterized protein n=1 Tax=Dibothriocephalus latus TaxID=60516 RepID=A0A3P7QLR7_DIBLA|nr:unnamed protein product [Dibothriocephalus latus]